MVIGLGVGLTLAMAGAAVAAGTLDQSQANSDFTEFLPSPHS